MATVTNILSLLKSFATHQNAGYIHYVEFSDYMRRFAQKHIAEQPDMANYLSQSQDLLQKELNKLAESKKIHLVMNNGDIKGIVVPAFFSDRFTSRINEILNNPAIPYPLLTDLPKYIPTDIVERRNASDLMVELLDGTITPDSNILYGLVLPKDLNTLIASQL